MKHLFVLLSLFLLTDSYSQESANSWSKNYDKVFPVKENRILVKKDGKFGYVNSSGEQITQIIYDDGFNFSNGYAIVNKNDKYAFVNQEGKLICPFIYDDAFNFNEGRAMVMVNNKLGYIDVHGELIIPTIYDEAKTFNDGYAIVGRDDKYGCIDLNGKIILDLKYFYMERMIDDKLLVATQEGLTIINKQGQEQMSPVPNSNVKLLSKEFLALRSNEGLWFIRNIRSNKDLQSPTFEAIDPPLSGDGLILVKKNGKYGFIDWEFKARVPFKYDYAEPFTNNMALIYVGGENNGKYGYIDLNGKEVIPPKLSIAYSFNSSGLGRVGIPQVNNAFKWGAVNTNGNLVIDFLYDFLKYSRKRWIGMVGGVYIDYKITSGWNLDPVLYGGKWCMLDQNGNVITKSDYDYVEDNGTTWTANKGGDWIHLDHGGGYKVIDGKWGFLDENGLEITSFDFDYLEEFDYENPGVWKTGMFWAVIGEKIGLVNNVGKIILPINFSQITPIFNESFLICQGGVRTKDTQNSTDIISGGKWGIFNQTGIEVLPLIYDNSKITFIGDSTFLLLLKDNKWGLYDDSFNLVIPFNYSSAEKLISDFKISKGL